jgi:FAD/FMN-containing dehydrogenase
VVVTTARLDRITVEPDTGTVAAGVGASWAGVAATARRHDLPPPWTGAGSLSDTVRTLGPCGVPAVRAVTVVGGDGVVRRVAPTGEPDLWASLRTRPGAADVLGVITGLELRPD